MKKIFSLIAVAVAMFAVSSVFTSCGSDDATSNTINPDDNTDAQEQAEAQYVSLRFAMNGTVTDTNKDEQLVKDFNTFLAGKMGSMINTSETQMVANTHEVIFVTTSKDPEAVKKMVNAISVDDFKAFCKTLPYINYCDMLAFVNGSKLWKYGTYVYQKTIDQLSAGTWKATEDNVNYEFTINADNSASVKIGDKVYAGTLVHTEGYTFEFKSTEASTKDASRSYVEMGLSFEYEGTSKFSANISIDADDTNVIGTDFAQ